MHRQIKGYFELANEYHVSAAVLWSQIMDMPYLYNPICYLLRHTIELQLKGLIVTELRKDDKRLVLNEIKLGKQKMSSIHSLLYLWEFYKRLLISHNTVLKSDAKDFIDKVIKKMDKKDFGSTRYRYPFDKTNKALNLFPVDIDLNGKVPDLELGIPTIIQCGEVTGVMNKGQKLMQDVSNLFEVTEYLFQIMENG